MRVNLKSWINWCTHKQYSHLQAHNITAYVEISYVESVDNVIFYYVCKYTLVPQYTYF